MTFRLRLPLSCACTLAAAALPLAARADDAPAASPVAANIALVSQYKFRGTDQTWGHPALQGGIDWSGAGGFYAGAWGSNVSANSYPGGGLELDLYAGFNGALGAVGYTLGAYGYVYPGANYDRAACPSAAWATPCAQPHQRFDTLELNAGLSWQWLSYKLSVAASDDFGATPSTGYDGSTRGSLYHDLTLAWPLAQGTTLTAHVGRAQVRARYAGLSADTTDYRIALAKTFAGGWSASAALAGADNDRFWRPPVGGLSMANQQVRALNRPAFIVQLGRTF